MVKLETAIKGITFEQCDKLSFDVLYNNHICGYVYGWESGSDYVDGINYDLTLHNSEGESTKVCVQMPGMVILTILKATKHFYDWSGKEL